MFYMPRPSHSSPFNHPNNYGWGVQIISSSSSIFYTPLLPRPYKAKIFSSTPYSQTPSAYVRPAMWKTVFHTHTKQKAKL
jgi:hypothetical protein